MKTFAEYLTREIRTSGLPRPELPDGACLTRQGRACRLCLAPELGYESEVPAKNRAFRSFSRDFIDPDVLRDIVPSPKGRGYRVVSKRKAMLSRGSLTLGLIDAANRTLLDVRHCDIESPMHAGLYRRIGDMLRHRSAAPILPALLYVILKGTYQSTALILTVSEITQGLYKAANTLSKIVTKEFPHVTSVFLHVDPSGDRYYMGGHAQGTASATRRLFGNRELSLRLGDLSFTYDIEAFSQVNLSAMPVLAETAFSLLEHGGTRLFDLYSGYGLFSLTLAKHFHDVRGLEISHHAVASASNNARRLKLKHVRFQRNNIAAESLLRLLPGLGDDDVVLLDPPRNGTEDGVIDVIADRAPGRVLHMFCNTELLRRDLGAWRKNGYTPHSVIPVDNFPATEHLEVFVLLRPARKNGGKS
jgi:23S rRNA (uracil1939-C5)-methyltransferase